MSYRYPGSLNRGSGGNFSLGALALILVALLFVGGCGAAAVNYYGKDTVTFTVDSKDRGGNNGGYRVYTDNGTYTIKDSLIYTRWNSADLYGSLEEGKTYECEAFGWRFGLFSWFKNLLDCEEVVPTRP